MTSVLFPSSALNPVHVDEHFAAQREVVDDLGESAPVVDFDDLANDGFRVFRRMLGVEKVVYRGWMLDLDTYQRLSVALDNKNVVMATSPEQYATAHHLPGWYETFKHLTPASAWVPNNVDYWINTDQKMDLLKNIVRDALTSKSFIVKDYVKSRKHEWETACFVPSIDRLADVAGEFLRLQGDDLAGGIVIREFEDFDSSVGEARVWWVDGKPVLTTAHPDTPDLLPTPDLEGVAEAVQALGCPFVTTDMALRTDGVWRVVEVGDGQVSDFPNTGDFRILAKALINL